MIHRRFLVLCLLLLSALLAAPSALAQSVCTTLTTGSSAVGDAYVYSKNPGTNYDIGSGDGYQGESETNGSKIIYTLIHVDVSAIPATATVNSATMTLQTTANASGITVDVDQILGGWQPTTVDWTSFSSDGFNSTPAAAFVPSYPNSGPVSFDLTALTQAWVANASTNDGVVLAEATGQTIYDFTPANNPQFFTVCYTPLVSNPSLAVQKTVSTNANCPGAMSATVGAGAVVTDCYQVTNTGNVTVSGIVVTDNGNTIDIGTLASGAVGSGSAAAAVTASSDTAAVATGTAGSTPVTATSSAVPVNVIASSLSLTKTVSTSAVCPGGNTIAATYGAPVTFCYVVTNTGGDTINGIVVSDAGLTTTIGSLAPGASASGSASIFAVANSDSAAVATGTDTTGATITSPDAAALVEAISPSEGLNATCLTSGVYDTVSSNGLVVGSCENGDGLTIADAVATCGTDANYFSYTCVDYPATADQPTAMMSWTGSFGCCSTAASICAQTQTDVGCGGQCPVACVVGNKCNYGTDCISDTCVNGLCAPSPVQDATCVNNGLNDTIYNVGYPSWENGTCADGYNAFSIEQAAAICGGVVKYYDYTCTDQPGNQRTWESDFSCCLPTCSDGIRDGTETDVDCGGQCPEACYPGQTCIYDTDCRTDYCAPDPTTGIYVCQVPPVLDGSCTNDGTNADVYNAGWPAHEDGNCDNGFEGFTIDDAAALCPGGVVKYFDYTCTDFPAIPPYQLVEQRAWEADYSCCVQVPAALTLVKTVSTTGTCPGSESVTVLPGTPVMDCYAVTNAGTTDISGVTVTDANGVTITIGDIPAGQSATGSQVETPVTSEDNTAVAQGTAPSGAVESNPSDAQVIVINPDLSIVKTASTTGACPGSPSVTVLSGTTVTYCYAVTNPGNTDVSGVTVTDNGVTIPVGDLPAGASDTVSESFTATADADTSATASGTATLTYTPVTSLPSDASVIVVVPALAIQKTVSLSGACPGSPSVTVVAGTTVTDCFTVTNTGDTDVSDVTVTDEDGSVVFIGDLPAGQTGSGSSVVVATVSMDTSAVAFGTATATDTPVTSPPSSAAILVVNPALAIVKTVSAGGSCPGSSSVTVLSGTTVTYCYAVTNTGDTPVTGVTVSDNGAVITVGDLAPGQTGDAQSSVTVTSSTSTAATASGTVTATGTQVSSPPSSASVLVVNPALAIVKTASTTGGCPGVPSVTIYAGTNVTYCYAVTNTGDTAVNAIVVSDGALQVSIGSLAAGQTGNGQASLVISANTDTPAVAAGTVAATGTPVTSPPSSAAVNVVFPALSIAVSVSENGVCPGAKVIDVEVGTPITWCYVVTNSGGTTVNDIQVTDSELGVVPGAPFSLTPGQSQTLSRADVAATSITLSASAAGIDAVLGGTVLSPQDSAAVNIVSPDVNISVTISTNGTCPGTSTSTVPAGETVTYCYVVTNGGDDTLYNVVVTTPNGTVIGTIATLPAGGSVTLSTPGVLVTGNATITATAAGSDAYGDSVTSTGTALLYALLPSLSLQKTVSVNGACPGVAAVTVLNPTQVTYCYLVTNTGQTGVNDITVGDNGTSTAVLNLSPGQSQMVSSTVTATVSTDTAATATGVNAPTGTPVSSNPSAAAVTVVNPALVIVKTVSLTGICPGSASVSVLAGTQVTYCYSVTNTGDTTISGVVVSDNGVKTTIGTLAPGQTVIGSAPYTATSTDADTSAVASGTVVVTGTPVSSPPSAALVHIIAPALSISVTVSTTGTCPGQPIVNVEAGTSVTWCYAVTNTGNVTVAGITVTDDVYGLVPGAPFSLAPGQTLTETRASAPTVSTTVAASATGTDTVVGSTVTSNLSSAAVNVVAPKVNIVVTVSTTGACPGSPSVSVPVGTSVTYCYDVSNAGDDTLVDIEVENSAGTVLATIPSLAPGASDQITGATAPATVNATVYASAVATDSYGDTVSANNTALVTVLSPALVLTKTAPATINAGACPSLGYTITVANKGNGTAAAPVVTDVLPSSVTYVSATTTSGSCSFAAATNTVTCTLAGLAAGASATITIDTTTLQASGTITNTASVTTTTPQSIGAINTGSASTEIISATCSSFGTISACFNGSSIQKGQTVWFTASAQCSGVPQDVPSTLWSLGGTINFSCNGKSYSVPVPPSQVTFDPACSGATSAYDDTHGQWNTQSPASVSGNVFIAAVQWQAPEDLPGGINPVTWSANIVSNNPKLNVSWQWSASVYDQAPCDYNSYGVKPLDDGSHCSGGSNWGSGWENDPCGTPETSKGSVCSGGRGNGDGDYCGQRTNPSCGQTPPVQACPSPGVGPLPALVLTKSAPATINAGACPSLPYTITVTNSGTATATAPVVTDALPTGVVYVSATTTSGSCSFASATNTVTCTLANLAAGASATVTIDTTTLLPSGTITNTATVITSTTQSSDTGNSASASTQIEAASCPSSGTISTNFNNTSIQAGETVWFTAVADVTGIPTSTTSSLWSLGGTISFTAGGTHYTVPVPPGKVTFEPSCTAASTTYDDVNNQWNTTAPCSFTGNVFVAAVAWQAPVNLPGGINPVTWSSNIVSNCSSHNVSWQWSAATYNQPCGDYNSLGVKPLDEGSKCGSGFDNSDPCGTPEGFKPYLCSGARGTGNGNYCGSRTSSSNCGHPPVQACQ